jgi:hypothetical protein
MEDRVPAHDDVALKLRSPGSGAVRWLDAVATPYVALHPSHCFIPTVSALDVATSDPFCDVDGDPNLPANTPFANLYVPAASEPHVTVTPGNAPWLLQEIDPVLVAVSPSRASTSCASGRRERRRRGAWCSSDNANGVS